MKSQQDIDLLFGKTSPKQMNIPKLRFLAIFALLLFTLTTLFYPLRYPSILKFNEYSKRPSSSAIFDHHLNESSSEARLPSISVKKCDIFSGEWVPNPEAPYYTNMTCREIHEHQNCMKFGRPDTDFMKWRWKPNDCELPIFNPFQFLEIVRGKSMAFVGDSVGRNQMQSMICLLSRVEWPIDASHSDDYNFKTWKYPSYNFTMATFWSPYLVRAQETDPNGPKHSDYFFNLYLDEFDEKWTTQIQDFDYVILNGGHWFFRPAYFYEKQKIVGCLYCHLENLTISDRFYGYRNAFRTAFRAINSLENFKGVTFLRTFASAHFEGGSWKEGGDCNRTRPFRSNETKLEGDDLELYRIQLKEFKIAKREGRKKGLKFRLFDTTQAMLLRPDGHPSKYGHSPDVPWGNDCVHWCLPGPIDTWSDFLLELLKMESLRSATEEEKLY